MRIWVLQTLPRSKASGSRRQPNSFLGDNPMKCPKCGYAGEKKPDKECADCHKPLKNPYAKKGQRCHKCASLSRMKITYETISSEKMNGLSIAAISRKYNVCRETIIRREKLTEMKMAREVRRLRSEMP